ncbi:unnamed protein product [Durusdinium trenchii]|uniref:Uncharacterized protein n=1 Tax=Durusdinium trenchii TaxID=1381693 RepID=A0ABP0R047_9DINO
MMVDTIASISWERPRSNMKALAVLADPLDMVLSHLLIAKISAVSVARPKLLTMEAS